MVTAGLAARRGDESSERLVTARGLSGEQLKAIKKLERRVVTADGGRLKLEWGALRTRPEDEVRDVLFWHGSELVGFLGMYMFGYGTIELTGMVDPGFRRQRIASSMLNTALRVLRERGEQKLLLVVPRGRSGGSELALVRGGQLQHSEHAMVLEGGPRIVLGGEPRFDTSTGTVALRQAALGDIPTLAELLESGFGWAPELTSQDLDSSRGRTLMIEHDGAPVGSLRLTLDGNHGRVYGFAVAPQWRRRGIGRTALTAACTELSARGATTIGLEVETDNDHALSLYESVGFRREATEDYYELTV